MHRTRWHAPRFARALAPLLAALLLAGAAVGAAPVAAQGATRAPVAAPAPQAQVVEVPLRPALPSEAPSYLAGILASAGALAVAVGARARLARARLDARMGTFVAAAGAGAVRGQRFQSVRAFQDRVIVPLIGPLAGAIDRLLPGKQVEQIRTNLAIAGLPYSRHLSYFLAAKAGLALGMPVLVVLYALPLGFPLANVILLAATGAVLGFYVPGIWLGRRMAGRRKQILRALPDALDLLSISVSAGLGFDGAMLEVVHRWQNPLTEEFTAVLRDLKLGAARRDALRAFAQRTGLEEVSGFAAAVIQADELGTPLKDVLVVQAEMIRRQRRYKAEETARKAVIKMLLPMVLFIFPAMFVVLLGPVVPSLRMLLGVSV